MRADDLEVSLASAESALLSFKTQLQEANERIRQLEEPANKMPFTSSQSHSPDMRHAHLNGLAQLPFGQSSSTAEAAGTAPSDGSPGLADGTGQALQVSSCCRVLTCV